MRFVAFRGSNGPFSSRSGAVCMRSGRSSRYLGSSHEVLQAQDAVHKRVGELFLVWSPAEVCSFAEFDFRGQDVG